jgi:hypothetical protein
VILADRSGGSSHGTRTAATTSLPANHCDRQLCTCRGVIVPERG